LAVTAGTVVVVRQAIGGGDLVNALSPGQVRSQYAAAGAPRPSLLATAGSSPTSPSPTATTPPPNTSTGGSKPAHSPSSSTTPTHHSGSGSTHGSGSTPSHSPTSGGSVTLVLTSSGGSVVARCSSASSSASVYLVSWSPAQGYQVDEVRRGPAAVASIHLESDHGEVSVNYSCSATGPVQQVQNDDGTGGGDD